MYKSIPFVDLTAQYHNIQPEIDAALTRVINRGWYILGQELEAFEEEFARYCGTQFAVGVGSGTEALHLALLACGVNPGDEVITSPNTAVPTISAIHFANATPVFVDIDAKTYTLDINALDSFLQKRAKKSGPDSRKMPKAIIPVHLYGHPADMAPILQLAKEYGLVVIEDACQAHGAKYREKIVGAWGDAGCFSFYPTKNLGAYGDGGMITTQDSELTQRLHMLRNYGKAKTNYNIIRGYNSRLDEIQAAILRAKLPYLDRWNEKRRRYARLYNQLLNPNPVVIPTETEHVHHVFHLYVIRTTRRDKLRSWLQSQGIMISIHYPLPLHFQPAFADLGYKKGDFPEAEKHCAEILSLPLYPEMTEDKIEYIAQEIRQFFQREPDGTE